MKADEVTSILTNTFGNGMDGGFLVSPAFVKALMRVFRVERHGWFRRWEVWANWRYGGYRVSRWMRRGAYKLADRLNEIAETFEWPFRFTIPPGLEQPENVVLKGASA